MYGETDSDKCFRLLHTGWVKFGDAHPAYNNVRALRVPAAFFYPKLGGLTETFVHHYVFDLLKEETNRASFALKQLKQCRSGFYTFSEGKGWQTVPTPVSFALKSGYDHNSRRSAESQMYGYESLNAGLKMQFVLSYEEEKISDDDISEVKDCLVGKHRVGRSRSAQYGSVDIQVLKEENVPSYGSPRNASGDTVIYADSRLIFFDAYGMPTFTPTASDFGFSDENYEINWAKSQIRIFQYSPWNYKRQAFDTDRCGIEKGSVLVISPKYSDVTDSGVTPTAGNNDAITSSEYVGEYRLEGFGHIIINPTFLKADDKTGKAKFPLTEATPEPTVSDTKEKDVDTPLMAYLKTCKKHDDYIDIIYTNVAEYPDTFEGNETFASQWGQIRKLAMASDSVQTLRNKLFTDKIGYLMHGVGQEKWKGHTKQLKEFVNKLSKEMPDSYVIMAVINLAAVMGKACSRKKQQGKEVKK
jgi:hypothetical protein